MKEDELTGTMYIFIKQITQHHNICNMFLIPKEFLTSPQKIITNDDTFDHRGKSSCKIRIANSKMNCF